MEVIFGEIFNTISTMLNYRVLVLLLLSCALPTAGSAVQSAAEIDNAWALPPVVLDDLHGQHRKLYDWRGNVIILNFWATWCGPCQVEIPHLQRYQAVYGKYGLQVIGIGLDDLRKLRNFARTLNIQYPVLHADPERDFHLLVQWGNAQAILPYTVVIGRDGRLHYSLQGVFDDAVFNEQVLPLLQDGRQSAIAEDASP